MWDARPCVPLILLRNTITIYTYCLYLGLRTETVTRNTKLMIYEMWVCGVFCEVRSDFYSIYYTLSEKVQTCSLTLSYSYSTGTWLQRPEHDADHSPPYSTKVKNERHYNPFPPYAFTAHTGITLVLHLETRSRSLPSALRICEYVCVCARYMRLYSSGFHKMRKRYWLAEKLLATLLHDR
jgi:hypothetical protein